MYKINSFCRIEIDSEDFTKHLEPFLFERTAHFQHEFIAFAQSPFDLKAFDDRSKYNFLDTEPPHQPPPSDVPSTSAAATIRERLMAELAFETPCEISPLRQRGTSGLTSSWESPPTIIIESSDNENNNENQPASQSQQTAHEAERQSHTFGSEAKVDDDNDHDLCQDKHKRKGRSKRRDRDRQERDNYEYYEEERVVRRRGADGRQTEERWFVSRQKETWPDSVNRHPRSPRFRNRKHSRHTHDRQRQSSQAEPAVGDSTNQELSCKQPRLRSVVFVVHRQDQEEPISQQSQQTDTVHSLLPPTEQRTNSPTCEELEHELEALESGIHATKSQLLRVLQRIEDMKAAHESQGQQ